VRPLCDAANPTGKLRSRGGGSSPLPEIRRARRIRRVRSASGKGRIIVIIEPRAPANVSARVSRLLGIGKGTIPPVPHQYRLTGTGPGLRVGTAGPSYSSFSVTVRIPPVP
jgi:hypothetical protein